MGSLGITDTIIVIAYFALMLLLGLLAMRKNKSTDDYFVAGNHDFNPDTGEVILGDIIISVDKVREQAENYGHSKKREFAFLITHSMLHLFGYDHMQPDEALVMEKKQHVILDELNIPRQNEEITEV